MCLTNRFHVVVRLFCNRSQMTSKCGKNKQVAHEAIPECVTDVLGCDWKVGIKHYISVHIANFSATVMFTRKYQV